MGASVYRRKADEPRVSERPDGVLELVGTAARIRDDQTGRDELYLNRGQAEALVRLVGGAVDRGEDMPVCDNHREDMRVGDLLGLWINEDHDVRAHVRMNGSDLGAQAGDLVRAGLYRGLSLHLRYLLKSKGIAGPDGTPLLEKDSAQFKELSVCPTGADEFAVITAAASLGIDEDGGTDATVPFKADAMSQTEPTQPPAQTEAPEVDLAGQLAEMRRAQAELSARLEASEKERAAAEKRQAKAEAEQKKLAHESERDRRFAKWKPELEQAEAACRELAGRKTDSMFARRADQLRGLLSDPELLMKDGAEEEVKDRLTELREFHQTWKKEREARAPPAQAAAPTVEASASGGSNFREQNAKMRKLSGADNPAPAPESATAAGFDALAADISSEQKRAAAASQMFRWGDIPSATPPEPTQAAPAEQTMDAAASAGDSLVAEDPIGLFVLEAAASGAMAAEPSVAEMLIRGGHIKRSRAPSAGPRNHLDMCRSAARAQFRRTGGYRDYDRVLTPHEMSSLQARPATQIRTWAARAGQPLSTDGMQFIGRNDGRAHDLVLFGGH